MARILSVVIVLFLAVLFHGHACAGLDGNALPDTGGPAAPPHLLKHDFADPTGAKAGTPRHRYKEGELLVKFRPQAPEEAKKNVHEKHKASLLKDFPALRLQHVKLKKGTSAEEAVKLYQADPEVEYAEPNFLYQAQLTPNDPQYSQLWGLAKMGAPAAWDTTTGSENVVVAVIDTGVDYSHTDLQANMWRNPTEIEANGIDEDANGFIDDAYGINAITRSGNPFDDNGHGTHVAGTIGAAGSNGLGVVGVSWKVRIIACKFLDNTGNGYLSDAVACLQYVKGLKDRGVNVVATSNSWGGGGNSNYDNDATDSYPSGYDLPNVISVAATDNSDQLASFSNFGRYTVDLGAPGTGILSTLPAQNSFGITGGYGTLSGTSMATPHVTGLAALLQAQDPSRDWKKIKNLVLSGGDDVAALAGKSLTGKRVNALGSMSCISRPLLSAGRLPATVTAGQSYTLTAVSINCDAAAGPVTLTTSDGASVVMNDSGIAPDAAAGDGVFSGTWVAGATTPVLLTFSSSAGSQSVSIPPLQASWYIPDARVNSSYSQRLAGSGGFPPYAWSITSGALPAGLALDPDSGLVSGQAGTAGNTP